MEDINPIDRVCEIVHECFCRFSPWREVNKCFEPLSREEVSELKIGEALWLDVHYNLQYTSPNATTKTYQAITLISEEKPEGWDDSRYFTYKNGWGGTGSVTVGDDDRGLDCRLWKLTNPENLTTLIKLYGRWVTDVKTHAFHTHRGSRNI